MFVAMENREVSESSSLVGLGTSQGRKLAFSETSGKGGFLSSLQIFLEVARSLAWLERTGMWDDGTDATDFQSG